MKSFISTFLLLFIVLGTNVYASNSGSVTPNSGSTSILEIDNAMQELDLIDRYVEKENANFQSLLEKNPELLQDVQLASQASEDEFFAKGDDRPLGIPGFLWGFCFGVIGMLVVYLTMDEGEGRKKEVKNALYGCIVGTLIGYLIYALVLAANVSVDPVIFESFNIV